MATILLGWELGEGLGHAAALRAVADALRTEAANGTPLRIIFVLQDPIHVRHLFRDRPEVLLPAPESAGGRGIRSESGNIADILADFGFAEEETLLARLAAWDDIISLIAPDLIVADYSPSLCLAARGRIPVLVTGNGFTLPPDHLPHFPSLRRETVSLPSQSVILEVLNSVLKRRGQPGLERLPQLFSGDLRALFSLPQLDPYLAYRRDPFIRHYEVEMAPVQAPAEPRVFYYGQQNHPHAVEIGRALLATGYRVSMFARGKPSVTTAVLERLGIQVFHEPPKLADVLRSASVVVSHGTTGLVSAALIVGRAQVVLPENLEATFAATRLAEMGVGSVISGYSAEAITGAVENASQCLSNRAQEVALEIARNTDLVPLCSVARRCFGLFA